jgi:hypothetical protein
MPDLDEVLATLVADVGENTHAPGAANAIKRAQRRRASATAAAAFLAVAAVAVGSALGAGTRSTSEGPSPIGQPTTPTSATPSWPAVPGADEELNMILARAAAQVPGWTVADDVTFEDWAYQGKCSGLWSDGSLGGSSDGVSSFRSKAQASDAVDRLAENLASCTKTTWRTRPIAQTGAILATSRSAVAWIVQDGTFVGVFQVPTTDGPPPVDVQVAIVEWNLHRDMGRSFR